MKKEGCEIIEKIVDNTTKTFDEVINVLERIVKIQNNLIDHVLFLYKFIAFFLFWNILIFLISPFLLKGFHWFNDLSEAWQIFILSLPAIIIADIVGSIIKKFIKLKE